MCVASNEEGMVVVRVQERCGDRFGSYPAQGTCRDSHRKQLRRLTWPAAVSLLVVSNNMFAFTDVLLLVGSIAISLAILVPLAGALVRFRAHYNPKGLQLDPEGGVQPHTGPVITSFVAMLVRVYRIEVRLLPYFEIRAPLNLSLFNYLARDGQACTRD